MATLIESIRAEHSRGAVASRLAKDDEGGHRKKGTRGGRRDGGQNRGGGCPLLSGLTY